VRGNELAKRLLIAMQQTVDALGVVHGRSIVANAIKPHGDTGKGRHRVTRAVRCGLPEVATIQKGVPVRRLSRPIAGAAVAAIAIAAPAVASASGHSHHQKAAVFVQTDNPSANQIIAYSRAGDGSLTLQATYATGGKGAAQAGAVADPLASQGSLVTADGGRYLLAVNAGSDTISLFKVHGDTLTLRQTIATEGVFPSSIAVRDDLVYVLNAAGEGSVNGYHLRDGRLHPIAGSNRVLNLGNLTPPNFLASPGQIGISPDGKHLVVTTKGSTSSLAVFRIRHNGNLSASAKVTLAAAPAPYSFVFDHSGRLVVTEAGTSTVTTYSLAASGAATAIGSVSDGYTALCWITRARGFYYGSNSGSNNLSSFTVSAAGQPVLVSAVAATTSGGGDIDSASADHGRFLYVQNGAGGTIDEFAVSSTGALTKIGTITGLPIPSEGIAAVG